ncbi:biosynthetic arginine decarboxylase [Endozoicomonas sp. SCSIO W0465]|uniref:biosynthetic arginine decarboxylase n=1 Tax=Endozoicomonas sp. SCSIO W0465 TaxID=2918516 RepID=UPI002075C17E|nr:biosynthetic arginine decarboxylase [Endozoicomonas sp. SCSIO W0465]USE36736.1 biosynthetic arginine decarboxylase [Endozoicomonas sp. SCSIO W0465]
MEKRKELSETSNKRCFGSEELPAVDDLQYSGGAEWEQWNVNEARSTYNIRFWSQNHFDLNDQGHVTVNIKGTPPVELNVIARQLNRQGVSMPVLVRFPQVIHQRVDNLCNVFNHAISEYGYNNRYLAVYPIKVNQQRTVVEDILSSQTSSKHPQLGLESGSKPELLAVLALAKRASSVIVCNGYKDREYIRLALIGEKLGHQVYIVLEKLTELDIVLSEAASLGVRPRLGLRVRLAFQGKGKWQASGGEKSKFGLSASQVLHVLDRLKHFQQQECLQLLHFHLGSQIANIHDVRKGVSECGRIYAQLHGMGVPIQFVDVGGGLAVDYEGTRSQNTCSMNYSLQEYANNIIYTLGDICQQYDLPVPGIISESGRHLVAHHAVLITDILGVESYEPEVLQPPAEDAPLLLHNMWSSRQDLRHSHRERSLVEIYHDSQADLAEVHTQFDMGLLGLEHRAWAENICLNIYHELKAQLSPRNQAHRPVIDELSDKLADKFYVNFSLFQSLPDAWGIDQIFPVMPLSGLDRPPVCRAVMLDITCDSDGVINHYVDGQGIETTLPVPQWQPENPFLIGFFMVGAYQEILGNMHNLFGDTDVASVRINGQGEVEVTDYQAGDTVEDVMRYVNLQPESFLRTYRQLVRECLPPGQQRAILAELESGLRGYTYLEFIGGSLQ